MPLQAKRVADRYLGAGRHPVAGLDQDPATGFVTTYMEVGSDEPSVAATQLDIWGHPLRHVVVSDGAAPLDEANPVAAALPDGSYAIAWSDFDGDGADLGVALRRLESDGTLGALQSANESHEFSQLNADLLWTDSQQLVAAWEDYSDPANGPDLVYRTFDASLNPTSGDVSLATGAGPEAAIALAKFNGGWAAAYREGLPDGQENVVVVSGPSRYRLGPVHGGPLDDRPTLVALDEAHLLVAFSVGTDLAGTGLYNLPRLRYAVIDTADGAPAPVSRSLDPLDDVFTTDNTVAQMSPALVAGNEGPYLAWRSEARPGDASGDQLWLKRLPWRLSGDQAKLDSDLPEMLIPRVCDGSAQDQRSPALAQVALPPGNALAIAWTDFAKAQGAGAGEPDVVIHYAPTHLSSVVGAPQTLKEAWSGSTGSSLPVRWATDAVAPVTWSVQGQELQFSALGAPGASFVLVNDHAAKDVDVVTTTRLGYPTTTAVVARADAGTTPQNYLGASVTTLKSNFFRVYSVINGVQTDLLTYPVPKGFYAPGIGVNVDYRVRFRTNTNADGSLFLGMKVWRVGATEPATWLMSTTLPTTHAAVQALGSVAGRFGVWASVTTANGGRMYFDDLQATFFEGTSGGNLDLTPSPYPLLLRRDAATYRQCNPSTPCTVTGGCCAGNADCENGLACSHLQSEGLGAGSHASVCVADHCADGVISNDEVRADCGGADCATCACTSSATLGTPGYCAGNCLCGRGEYPCVQKADCLPGLMCGNDTGDLFGGPFQSDACVPPHCVNRVLDADELKPDCGGSCGGGDCSNVCPQANGTIGHCRTYCRCGLGEGTCYQDDECKPGLACLARGIRFGQTSGVCAPATCFNNIRDAALGETSSDCGGPCGCGDCPAGCTTDVTPTGATVPIPTVTPYIENFDSIGTAAVATLPSGWRVDKQASPRVVGSFSAAGTTTLLRVGAAMSSSSTNAIYNFGAGVAANGADYWRDAADRAIGWLASGAAVGSGGTKSGNLYVQLQAPANVDLRSLTLAYRVEKYRKGTTLPGWKVQLYYSANGVSWASAGSAFSTSFAADADANGFDPAPGSSTSVNGTLDLFVKRGVPYYLAWGYTTSSSNSVDATSSQALAIDDVSILGVPSE